MVAFLIQLVKLRLRPQLQQRIIRILTLIQILVWVPGKYFFVIFRKVFLCLSFFLQKESNNALSIRLPHGNFRTKNDQIYFVILAQSHMV